MANHHVAKHNLATIGAIGDAAANAHYNGKTDIGEANAAGGDGGGGIISTYRRHVDKDGIVVAENTARVGIGVAGDLVGRTVIVPAAVEEGGGVGFKGEGADDCDIKVVATVISDVMLAYFLFVVVRAWLWRARAPWKWLLRGGE